MIDGYRIVEHGIVKQINPMPFDYGKNYQDALVARGELNNYMSYLRYGYLIGSLNGAVPSSILDIGYGDGSFLNVCKQMIPRCFGYDISGVPVPEGCTEIKNLAQEEEFFDVACFFDSLEHFHDINVIHDLNCRYVYISLPECHYLSDEWFKNWKHRKPDEHIWHFNANALVSFFLGSGYGLVKLSRVEDVIRKDVDANGNRVRNILSAIFRK